MADNINIKGSSSLDQAINEILNATEGVVAQASKDAAKKAAQQTVKTLKASSPKRKGSYAKGWKATKVDDGYVVHNETDYQLIHLLEHGHDIVVDGQKVGRVAGNPHVKPAEQQGIKLFEDEVVSEITRRLGNG